MMKHDEIQISQIAQISDNLHNWQTAEPAEKLEWFGSIQLYTGIRNAVIRHPYGPDDPPLWPAGDQGRHPHSRVELQQPARGHGDVFHELAKTHDTIMVYLGSPCPTAPVGHMKRGLPPDARISEIVMRQFGAAEPDWSELELYLRPLLASCRDSPVDDVVFDNQSTVDPATPWLEVLRVAQKILDERSTELGVESPPHPDSRFDGLRELVTVSASVWRVWETNRDKPQTYPPHHRRHYVFLDSTQPDGGIAWASPEGLALVRERCQQVCAWSQKAICVANWYYVRDVIGIETPQQFSDWINTK